MPKLLVLLVGISLLVGCGANDTPKSSHFEHDHEVAQHWPDDLADAAKKIRERLNSPGLETVHDHPSDEHSGDEHHHGNMHEHDHERFGQNPGDEIADIVSWLPEIAADTNLSEQDWNRIDNAARSLSADLNEAGNTLTQSNQERASALCELIAQVLPKVSDQPPASRVSSP
ncbi:hypothetical protein FYK55_02940 [Roseiconus nitratireducens]|uniref:Uncharacterized protein n=1 Tax=Roseiconus nitratireducens TaxID=2605748 RepID=A0A5M6DEE0_9BACT|nr:hypothetical protein [Roseiconus nitratireducens]KAA5545887.1 hypothetical protein FYK55_02940 [Roseiconus nitratireducens]